jgi:GPH family glycoside/pentoside/hexuronide:cation symporter
MSNEEKGLTEGVAEVVVDAAIQPTQEVPQAEIPASERQWVTAKEQWFYVLGMFFLTAINGVVGNYRYNFMVNILAMDPGQIAIFNAVLETVGALSGIFLTIGIEMTRSKWGKFRPWALFGGVAVVIMTILSFWVPPSRSTYLVVVTVIGVLYLITSGAANALSFIPNVMTFNRKERNSVITTRNILTSIGSSAPLLFFLIFEMMYDKGIIFTDYSQVYLGTAVGFGVVGLVFIVLGVVYCRERIPYTKKQGSLLKGAKQIVTTKNFWIFMSSDVIKRIRSISSSVGTFLALVLLGSTGKYLLFALPTGVGTAIGMIIAKGFLKKTEAKVLYIYFGAYSVLINLIAFAVGFAYLPWAEQFGRYLL